jgi:hypothetical protein
MPIIFLWKKDKYDGKYEGLGFADINTRCFCFYSHGVQQERACTA